MSKCNFEIPFTGGASELIERAKQAIVKAGGEVSGEPKAGNFFIPSPLGKISGSYSISGQSAHFEITDKPGLIGCGLIESTVKKFLIPENLS
jgi:hypothetical protein